MIEAVNDKSPAEQENVPYIEGLSEDQVLQVASMAEQAAPFLNFQHQMHVGRTLKLFQSLPYEHTKAILELKAVDMAVHQLHKDFKGIIAHAQRIVARRNAQNDPARKKQAELDKQGFGL